MKNEKKALAQTRAGLLTYKMKQLNHTTAHNQFQYQYTCSFCWRELPNGSVRFAGFGVCPPHLKLAETIVEALRRHRARYFNSDFTEAK